MYLDYFGFASDPFSISPDPRFLYLSDQHREALAHLLYGIRNSGGFVLLTGEVGTGKTTICRCLLQQLPEDTDVVLLWNPKMSVLELLASICDELQIAYPERGMSVKLLIDRLNASLLAAHGRGRSVVIIIDEAQNLRRDVLEQLRLLTNLETNTCKLLQIILLGQPELLEMLARPEMRQLAQRVTARYHLLPLPRAEVGKYLEHRLAVAGSRGQIFPPAVVPLLHTFSHGVPRLINILCSRALLGAYAQGRDMVSPSLMKMAALEVMGALPNRFSWPRAVVIGLAVLAATLLGTWFVPERDFHQIDGLPTIATEARQPAAGGQETLQEVQSQAEVAKMELVAHPQEQDESLSPAGPLEDAAKVEGNSTINEVMSTVRAANAARQPAGGEADPAGDRTKERLQQAEEPLAWLKALGAEPGMEQVYQTLFRCWQMDYQSGERLSPPVFARKNGLYLQTEKGSFGYLRRLNRPAILRLVDLEGNDVFAVLIAIREETVVLAKGTDRWQVAIDLLNRQWQGEFTLLWQPPPGYSRVIVPGDRGAVVRWLAQALARLYGRQDGFGEPEVYGGELLQDVKTFQLAEGIQVDGLVGPMTLIRLNSRTTGGQPRLE
ncbi:MAG: AAA family ATPase [Desulfopila sp.]